MKGEHTTFQAEVIGDGRITIPEATRKVLGIRKGDILSIAIVKVKHIQSASSLKPLAEITK